MIQLTINQKNYTVEVSQEKPLLWVLRDTLQLTGTKFGCGIGQCGACTVHLNGEAVRSCQVPVVAAAEMRITTIEGLSSKNDHPIQKAWKEMDVPQCGFCQSGQIMAAAALIRKNPKPDDDSINSHMTNLCRCGTYTRIRKGIHRAAEIQSKIRKGRANH